MGNGAIQRIDLMLENQQLRTRVSELETEITGAQITPVYSSGSGTGPDRGDQAQPLSDAPCGRFSASKKVDGDDASSLRLLGPDETEAVRIACPDDTARFLRYFRSTRQLRSLPKAHLHIHANACRRNCDLKSALAAFNMKPGRLRNAFEKLKADAVQEDKDLAAGERRWSCSSQLQLLSGNKLCLPSVFWAEDGSLKHSAYEVAAMDSVSPWSGCTGWNPPECLWHGMGGFRDYNLVANLVDCPSMATLDYWVAASEDARAEGIRWVEYCGCAFDRPKASRDDLGRIEIAPAEYKRWRDKVFALWQHVTSKVPEVGVGFVLPLGYDDATSLLQYARAFTELFQADVEMARIVVGVGEVGAGEPGKHAEVYELYSRFGLPAVNVHVGEWSPLPARAEMAKESRKRMRDAIKIGVKRIGHGIIAHTDTQLMSELKKKNVCLEVCPTSNLLLDNVPGGLATHPLRGLFDAGVPCVLAADDPAHCGAHNSQGLVREFMVARDALSFTPVELAQLAMNSFKYSSAPRALKQQAYCDINKWLATQLDSNEDPLLRPGERYFHAKKPQRTYLLLQPDATFGHAYNIKGGRRSVLAYLRGDKSGGPEVTTGTYRIFPPPVCTTAKRLCVLKPDTSSPKEFPTFVVDISIAGIVQLPANANGSWMDPDYEE